LAATIPQDIATQVLLRQGTPPSGIISAARQNGRDLIVLPTRGLKGLNLHVRKHRREVVRYALYPVFTIGRDLHRQVKAKN
jgi:nucleotide-binding universal stress UspA family protein